MKLPFGKSEGAETAPNGKLTENLLKLATPNISGSLIIVLLITTLLWKGGKSLESTWVLLGVAALLTFLGHWWSVRQKNNRSLPLIIWLPVIALIIWTALSFYFSRTQNYGLDELLRTTAFGLIFLWVYRFSKQAEATDYQTVMGNLVRWVGIGTILAAAFGLLVYMFQPVDRFVGTFFDMRFHTDYWPNAWADWLLLAWPLIYYWSFRQLGKASRLDFVARCLPVGIVMSGLLLSYSRAGILAFGAQVVCLLLIFSLQRNYPARRRFLKVLGVVVAMGIIGFFGGNQLRSNLYEVQEVGSKITFEADEQKTSVDERVQFWSQAIELTSHRPIFGFGPYSFRFVQPAHQTGVLATSDHPHNVILKLAMERGILAALIFLGLLLYIGISTLVLELHSKTENTALVPFGTLALVALAGLFFHNLVDYNLQFVAVALLMWILLAILAGRLPLKPKFKVGPAFARFTEITIAIVILILAFIEGGWLVTSSIGRHAETAGNTEKALLWYDRSSPEIFSRDMHLSRAKLLLESKDYEAAITALDDYRQSNPHDFRAWRLRGEIAMAEGQPEEAAQYFLTASQVGGQYNDVGILLNWVLQTRRSLGEVALADYKPKIDELIREYGTAITENRHFIALSPNVESFTELTELMSRLYPDEAPLYQVIGARAAHNAKVERDRIAARPPGFLW